MLKSLVVENYRAFESFKIDHTARVNLIVGTNNSGKSSLLEAIYLLTSEDASYS
ncbi:MAG: AAA family ATPase, partial [Chloroflexota bacterium]|nr:AAA family ATPase [Chloroflexota bacterium]